MSEKILYSDDAERAVLGALLTDPAQINGLDLDPRDFYLQKNATIYAAMLECAKDGEPADIVILSNALDNAGKLDRGYLLELSAADVNSQSAQSYAEIVKDLAKRRKAAEIAGKLATAAYNPKADLEAAITDATGILSQVRKDPKENNQRKTSWTLSEILTTDFPEPNWIVPNLVQEGLVMLAGRPKIGKSWMLLQMAGAVASGGRFLGEKVEQGEVLYLALEDNPRRIQSRAAAMKLPECPITFEFYWRPLQEDGLNDLYLECERERYRLIIIDTLARVIPGINLNDENPVALIVNSLQSMALNHGLTILPAHHTRKSNGIWADPIDDIMGSTAISRAIDAVLAIYRQQGKAGMLLKGRGRDTEEFDLAVNFDGLTKCWQSLGDVEEVLMSETKQEILSYLEGAGKSSLASIAQGLGKDKSNVNKNLQDLTNDGKVRKEYIEGKVFYEKV
jgi:hypothetical protein